MRDWFWRSFSILFVTCLLVSSAIVISGLFEMFFGWLKGVWS